MPQIVTKLPQKPQLELPKRVAAYARVSSKKDSMHHSLSEQVSYFSNLIQAHPNWVYAGVFSDDGETGTRSDRGGFQDLLAECRAGHIDIVVMKSVSRLARNTVIMLETIREMKALGIDFYFEKENLHTLDGDGELVLTILSSYAQEESRSVSENQRWRVRRSFEAGKPWNCTMLGYRYENGALTIVPAEAETVRFIFSAFMDGVGVEKIARLLNEKGVVTRFGNRWGKSSVKRVLTNYSYTGNLLLQSTFRRDYINKESVVNNGELPMYHVEGSHEAIISSACFEAVQEEIRRRAEKQSGYKKPHQTYPFSGLLVCSNCGAHYRRKVTAKSVVWICNTYNSVGKDACASKQIPEATLMKTAAEVLGVAEISKEICKRHISQITVESGNKLIFTLTDGRTVERIWADRSRRDSWTPAMKAEASERTKRQWREMPCQE